MKKEHVLIIVLVGGLWGLSEAVLGDALYSADVRFSSVYLTMIAFFLLAAAARFVPFRGAGTAIGLLAMCYKFLNVPFFACHLTGIALLGVSFDLVFRWKPSSAADGGSQLAAGAKGALAAYLGYSLFYLAMVLVFRNEYWLARGWSGLVRHVGLDASLAAAGCALAVPLGLALGRRLRGRVAGAGPLGLQPRLAGALATLAAVCIWAWGMTAKLWS